MSTRCTRTKARRTGRVGTGVVGTKEKGVKLLFCVTKSHAKARVRFSLSMGGCHFLPQAWLVSIFGSAEVPVISYIVRAFPVRITGQFRPTELHVVPYKITWFRRGWVGLGQLIWAIVVPMPGHLDVYSWSERTYPRIIYGWAYRLADGHRRQVRTGLRI